MILGLTDMVDPPLVVKSADISGDELYRYRLVRSWSGLPRLCWIMLNPSTADSFIDDRTIGRCMRFADRWGYGSMSVINLYALRTSKPEHLLDHPDPESFGLTASKRFADAQPMPLLRPRKRSRLQHRRRVRDMPVRELPRS
jgi:hypothetical protein